MQQTFIQETNRAAEAAAAAIAQAVEAAKRPSIIWLHFQECTSWSESLLRDEFEWRGLGVMKKSALALRCEYAEYDAAKRFDLAYRVVPDNKACECGTILRGVKRPQDCAIFGTVRTPKNPVGSCMVSSEGACAAHYTCGRYKA